MRKLDSQIHSIAKGLTYKVIARRVKLAGKTLSRSNAVMYSQALRTMCFLCEDIAIHFYRNPQDVIPRITAFLHAVLQNDIVSVISFMSDVRDFYNQLTGPISFRLLRSREASLASRYGIHEWKMLLAPISELEQNFISDPLGNTHQYRDVSSFLVFLKKLPFTNIGVEEKMLDAYLETEKRLASHSLDDEVCMGVKSVITRWFRDFKISDFRPRHGNGSTALGRMSLYEKYHNLHADDVLLRCLNVDRDLAKEYFPVGVGRKLQRCSKLEFVPKTATKLRPISMEEPSLQYIQQGVRIELQRYIKNHRFLRNVIKFDSQSQNQMYAHMGSYGRNISTIDLSAASDSVSLNLARKLFSGVPHLYRFLMATRSTQTKLPDGTCIKLRKFASMGSATTFPVECIIFAAVVQYSYDSYDGIEKELDPNYFSIYGDDIICSDYITDSVISNLEKCGFLVNKEKSFFGQRYFRESCGKEYMNGVDVSPVYYRCDVVNSESPESMMSLVGLSNTYYVSGYPKLSRYCVRWAKALFGAIAFTSYSDDTSKVFSNTSTNYHLVVNRKSKQLSSDYQSEYRAYRTIRTVHQKGSTLADEDNVRLFEWLRSHRSRSNHTWYDFLYPATKGDISIHRSSTVFGWSYLEV